MSSILISIGTSTLSVAIVALIWKTAFGNQPVEDMFNRLSDYFPLFDKGIKDVYINQCNFPFDKIHFELQKSRNVFILTQYFKSFIQINDIHKSFRRCLSNGGEIQILIYGPARGDEKIKFLRSHFDSVNSVETSERYLEDTVSALEAFRNSLPIKQKERFKFKLLKVNVIFVGMYGTDNFLWVTTLLNCKPGSSCPGFMIEKGNNEDKDLYSAFAEEFVGLWERN